MQIESVKEYWNKQPCNINHSKQLLFSEEYFNEVERKKYLVEKHIPAFADFNKYKGLKVLEIGCGIGTDAINFARAGAFYYGVDLTEKSIEITKQRFNLFSLSYQSLKVSNGENIDELYPNIKFDLIYSFGVIHHTPNPQAIIDNAYKLLVQGGEFKFMVYNKLSWKYEMIKHCGVQFEAQPNCPIANTYDEREIYNMLKQYKDISIKIDHLFPYKIEPYKNNIFEKEEYFELMPPEIFDFIESKFGFHLLVSCTKDLNELIELKTDLFF